MAPLRVDVISLVPEAFEPLLGAGVIGRAFAAGITTLHRHNPRDPTRRALLPPHRAILEQQRPTRLGPLRQQKARNAVNPNPDAPLQPLQRGIV